MFFKASTSDQRAYLLRELVLKHTVTVTEVWGPAAPSSYAFNSHPTVSQTQCEPLDPVASHKHFSHTPGLAGFKRQPKCLTYAVSLHVALVGHAVPPQTLVGIVPRETVLHPVVGCGGDDQQDITHNSAEQAPSHEAVHLELRQRGFCGTTVMQRWQAVDFQPLTKSMQKKQNNFPTEYISLYELLSTFMAALTFDLYKANSFTLNI